MLLVSPAIIQESVASSEIEAIHTTVLDVLEGDLFPEIEQKQAEKEVLRYRNAMNWGFKNLKPLTVSTRLILGIQSLLLSQSNQEYRKQQNKITNTKTRETIYTPPIASEIPRLIGNWENFVNNRTHELDPLVKSIICHYQFEAIHPFLDGNGRTGRILMILQLVNYEILSYPILYISAYLNDNRKEYYSLLREVSAQKKWSEYMLFMLRGFATQAKKTKETLIKIMDEHDRLKENCKTKMPAIYSADLIDHLFASPVTTPGRLAKMLDIHYSTASKYLHALKSQNILRDKKIGKYHVFYNPKLIDLLKS
jgi:Fic family protein